MLIYCLKCKQNTENMGSKVLKAIKSRTMSLSKCAVCNIKNSRFMKEKEAKGLLNSLGREAPLNDIPLLGKILF